MTILINSVFVALGGMAGSVFRYLLGLLPVRHASGFPFVTCCINITGAFAIGIIAGAIQKNSGISPRAVLFLKVGVCGGFTTFSTFSLETVSLLQSGRPGLAALYAAVSVFAGICAVFLGELLVCR